MGRHQYSWRKWFTDHIDEITCLRVEVLWPLEALVGYILFQPLQSHIHVWNMAWGWLAETEIWLSPIYGLMVRGNPSIGWNFHMLLWVIFLLVYVINFTGYYGDLMVDLSQFIFWLYVVYMDGSIMCSCYLSCAWVDKLLDGWWINGLTCVVATSLRGHLAFLVILKWSSKFYDHICIHNL